jgi:hypothetical protein
MLTLTLFELYADANIAASLDSLLRVSRLPDAKAIRYRSIYGRRALGGPVRGRAMAADRAGKRGGWRGGGAERDERIEP